MGNTLCGSVVVIAIPNAHTQDDATDGSKNGDVTYAAPVKTRLSIMLKLRPLIK